MSSLLAAGWRLAGGWGMWRLAGACASPISPHRSAGHDLQAGGLCVPLPQHRVQLAGGRALGARDPVRIVLRGVSGGHPPVDKRLVKEGLLREENNTGDRRGT